MAKAELVRRALDHFERLLAKKKNVVGLGRVPSESGDPDDWELAVYVVRKEPDEALDESDRVPAELELPGSGGRVSTQVIEQGEIHPEEPGLEEI